MHFCTSEARTRQRISLCRGLRASHLQSTLTKNGARKTWAKDMVCAAVSHRGGCASNSSCEKWRSAECVFNTTQEGCKFGDKCVFAHRRVEEQPSKRSKKNADKSAVAILKETKNLGCVFQDMEPPNSTTILRKSSNVRRPTRRVRFTKAIVRHANIRDQNPLLAPSNLKLEEREFVVDSGASMHYVLLTYGKVLSPFTIQN